MSVLPQNKHRPHIEQKIYLKEKSTSIFIEPLFSCEKGLKNSSKHRFVQEQYKTFFFKKKLQLYIGFAFSYISETPPAVTTFCNHYIYMIKSRLGKQKLAVISRKYVWTLLNLNILPNF